METDEDQRARARHRLGLSRELQQDRTTRPHPSLGGTRGYETNWRQEMLNAYNRGEAVTASRASIFRWRQRLVPYRSCGNKEAEMIVGEALLSLAVYLAAYPQAEADEIAIFIYDETGEVYSRQDIAQKMVDLNLSKKRASTEAYQAYTPENLLKFELFWTMPPPVGINGVQMRRLIDFDEFGIDLHKAANRRYGHSHTSVRVRKPGSYDRSTKFNVIIAIEPGDPTIAPHLDGSVFKPRKWIRIYENVAVEETRYADFCEHVCSSIENNPIGDVDNYRIFMWDNLSVHKTALVHHTVESRGTGPGGAERFEIVCRPPYQPKIAPVEYKICDICLALQRRIDEGHTSVDLRQMIMDVFGTLGDNNNYANTYYHCGYTDNGNYPPRGHPP